MYTMVYGMVPTLAVIQVYMLVPFDAETLMTIQLSTMCAVESWSFNLIAGMGKAGQSSGAMHKRKSLLFRM